MMGIVQLPNPVSAEEQEVIEKLLALQEEYNVRAQPLVDRLNEIRALRAPRFVSTTDFSDRLRTYIPDGIIEL